MTKDVRTATLMMSSLAPDLNIDVADTLKADSIKGKKLGVMRYMCTQFDEEVMDMFEACLDKLRKAGAATVDINEEAAPQLEDIDALELTKVLLPEFKDDMNSFLKGTNPDAVKCRTLADLIQFNKDNAEKEMPHFGQELFEMAEATKGLDEPDYAESAAKIKRLAGPEGIDKLLKDFGCSVLISPSCSPAFKVCLDGGDCVNGSGWDHRRSPMLPAVSGYPHLTVPMGRTKSNRPLGMSFIGTSKSEALLLSVGYAFEQINVSV